MLHKKAAPARLGRRPLEPLALPAPVKEYHFRNGKLVAYQETCLPAKAA